MKKYTNFDDMFNDPEYFPDEDREAVNIEAALIAKVIEARENNKMTQRELSELTGIKQPVISRLESQKTTPQLNTILKILVPLGYTLEVVPLRKPSV